MANATAEEQYMLELINESRLNPLASASRYISSFSPLTSPDPDIQYAFTYFGVNGSALLSAFSALVPVNPLAWNSELNDAASAHSAAMINTGIQSHQVPGEDPLGTRIGVAGYSYSTAAENVYAYSTGTLYAHAGFMVDWGAGPNGMQSPAGHRVNLMNSVYTEIGIDITAEGTASNPVGPQVVTEDLGARANKFFLLGVAYGDADGNKFYTVGEGKAGLVVTNSDGASFTTDAAGGYSVGFGANSGTFTLTGAGLVSTVSVTALVRTENFKLDVVNGNTLLTSGSISFDSAAIAEVKAIGMKGVSISAGAGNQRITGTANTDVLSGGDGNDIFTPGGGSDSVDGGAGTDIVVYTGASNQYIVGGASGGIWTITGTGIGAQILTNVEVLRFSNGDFTYNRSNGTLVAYTGTLPNSAPVVSASTQAVSTDANTAKTVTVVATDADGDSLTYAAGTAAHGKITGGSGGVFTYTPTTAYTGPDSFTVTISDGHGGTARQVVNITVDAIALNVAPVVSANQTVTTSANTAKTVTVVATDADGDSLTYSAGLATHGKVTGGSGGVFTYTPDTAYTGPDTFVISVSDGKGHVVVQQVAVTVNAIVLNNSAPTVAASQTVSTSQNVAKTVTVTATDPDGDTLAYSASAAAHGTITGGNGGVFTYTPAAGYVGSDSFVVTVNDGKGHQVNQVVNLAIAAGSNAGSSTPTFRLFTADGFAGEIGGSGSIVGSNGAEDIQIDSSMAGSITFDTSFNRGNDIIRLPGNASSYQVQRVNSAAVITDGTHSYTVPFSDVGTEIAFSDGVRTLTFVPSSSALLLGNQSVGTAAATIVARSEGTGNAIEQQPGAVGLVYLGNGADVALGGHYSVIGTSGNEDIAYKYGDVTLDASFNRGGDSLLLPTGAANFSAYIVGSMVVLKSALGSVTIPWGDAGMTLSFNGDARTLHYDAVSRTLLIGDQVISGTTASTATILSATGGGTIGGSGSDVSADVGNPSTPVTLTLDSGKNVVLADNASTSNFAYIKGFNAGDSIHVTGATGSDYNFTTIDADRDGKFNDLEISFNQSSALNYMVLIDAVSGTSPIYNEATAEVAFGSNFITFG